MEPIVTYTISSLERLIKLEEIAQTLTDLGLMSIQVKLLLILERFDYASVKDLAKASGIHRQEIYPVLFELQKLGLVEKRIGKPNQYKTIPLTQILNILLERKANWIAELQKKTPELVQKANAEIKSTAFIKQEDYDFKLITGIESFSQALFDWVKNAQSIDMILMFDRFASQIGERLKTANFIYKENVRVKIVTDALPDNVNISEIKNKNFEIRFTSFVTPVEIAIYDGNRAHLAIFSNRDNIFETEVAALTSNHPCYVKMLQSYFDVLWKSAKNGKQQAQSKECMQKTTRTRNLTKTQEN